MKTTFPIVGFILAALAAVALLIVSAALPLSAEEPKVERGIPSLDEQSQLALKYIEVQAAEITSLQNLVVALSINPKNQGSEADKQTMEKASKELQDLLSSMQSKYHAEKCNWAFATKQWSCPESK